MELHLDWIGFFGLDWFFQTGLLVRIFMGLDGGFSWMWLNGFMVLDQRFGFSGSG